MISCIKILCAILFYFTIKNSLIFDLIGESFSIFVQILIEVCMKEIYDRKRNFIH